MDFPSWMRTTHGRALLAIMIDIEPLTEVINEQAGHQSTVKT